MSKKKYTTPQDPKLTWREILAWLYKKHPVGDFTSRDVVKEFKITGADASMRLKQLFKWEYIKQTGTGARNLKEYILTEEGRKKAKNLK